MISKLNISIKHTNQNIKPAVKPKIKELKIKVTNKLAKLILLNNN